MMDLLVDLALQIVIGHALPIMACAPLFTLAGR